MQVTITNNNELDFKMQFLNIMLLNFEISILKPTTYLHSQRYPQQLQEKLTIPPELSHTKLI